MEIWTFALIVISCSTVFYYVINKMCFFENYGIPHVTGWPVFGSLATVTLKKKHMSEVIKDIYTFNTEAKYIGAFDLGIRPVIVLRDLELIKTITIKNADKFTDHFCCKEEDMDPFFESNLFNMTGDEWRELRSILTPAFGTNLNNMIPLMKTCASNLVDYLDDLPADVRTFIDTKELFSKYSNDIIANCSFGLCTNSFKNPHNNFYSVGNEDAKLDGVLAIKMILYRCFPRVIKRMNIRFVSDETEKFFKHIVSHLIKHREDEGYRRPDIIQAMMDARDRDTEILKLDLTMMAVQAFYFFSGGFETTSTQICLMAHELAINPEIQKRLQDEVDKVLETTGKGKVTYAMISEMRYLDAVFNETLRKHSQEMVLDRVCRENFELPPALPGGKPLTLRPGMCVWIPAHAIHNDPKYYEDPDVFNPDRYYDKKIGANDVLNMGFGLGPRRCVGSRLVIMQIKILFFHLLNKFSLKPNDNTCSPLTYSKQKFTLTPDAGFSLSIQHRD